MSGALDSVFAAAASRPANAYLFVGGRDAARAAMREVAVSAMGVTDDPVQAAAVRRGAHPDCAEIEPAGAAVYLASQLDDEILPIAQRGPLEAPRRVVAITDATALGTVLGSALLKTVEEPPSTTTFVLCAVDASAVPDTIVSRCVTVAVPPQPLADAAEALAAETGVDADTAGLLVRATGSADDARRFAAQAEWKQRRALWLGVPARLRDERVATLTKELSADLDAALGALGERQSEERADLEAHLGDAKRVRGRAGALKAIDERHKREERTRRTADQRLLLATLAGWYRDVMAVLAGGEPLNVDVADAVHEAALHTDLASTLAALVALDTAAEALEYNANAELAIEQALLDLAAAAR